jgi:hypothetical protein
MPRTGRAARLDGRYFFHPVSPKLTAAATDKICLNCHLNQPTHAGRIQSTHAKNAVSCPSCHKMHVNGGALLVARKNADVEQA